MCTKNDYKNVEERLPNRYSWSELSLAVVDDGKIVIMNADPAKVTPNATVNTKAYVMMKGDCNLIVLKRHVVTLVQDGTSFTIYEEQKLSGFEPNTSSFCSEIRPCIEEMVSCRSLPF